MKSKNCSRYMRDLKHLFPVYGKKQKAYLHEQNTQDLLRQINQKRYLRGIVYILFISALICSLSYGINCYRAYRHCIQSEPAYYYEEITTDSSSTN